MRAFLLALLVSLTAVGCAHRMILPMSDIGSCPFAVMDDRPDPEHLYAQAQVVLQIQTVPTVSESVRAAVCSSTDHHLLNGAVFTITNFSCIVSGFFKLTYIVELRDLLAKTSAKPLEVRAGNKMDTTEGYVPAGCEEAASGVIPLLARKIRDDFGG